MKNEHSDLRLSRLAEEEWAQVSPEGGRAPGEAGARAPRRDSRQPGARCAPSSGRCQGCRRRSKKRWVADPLQKGTFSLLLVTHFSKG